MGDRAPVSVVWVWVTDFAARMLRGVCGLTVETAQVELVAGDVRVEVPPRFVGTYSSIFSGYESLVMRSVFFPRWGLKLTKNASSCAFTTTKRIDAMTAHPAFDAWNVVESVCKMMAVVVLPSFPKPLESVTGRLMMCACMSVCCKNAVEQFAFPLLDGTEFRKSPLAVVYHIMFEPIIESWSAYELDPAWVHSRIERAEADVIERLDGKLFHVLNNGPVSCFEMELERLLDEPELRSKDVEESVVLH